ncbi:MAG: DUF1287 domain-containing protein [Hyphomicrobium sp.]
MKKPRKPKAKAKRSVGKPLPRLDMRASGQSFRTAGQVRRAELASSQSQWPFRTEIVAAVRNVSAFATAGRELAGEGASRFVGFARTAGDLQIGMTLQRVRRDIRRRAEAATLPYSADEREMIALLFLPFLLFASAMVINQSVRRVAHDYGVTAERQLSPRELQRQRISALPRVPLRPVGPGAVLAPARPDAVATAARGARDEVLPSPDAAALTASRAPGAAVSAVPVSVVAAQPITPGTEVAFLSERTETLAAVRPVLQGAVAVGLPQTAVASLGAPDPTVPGLGPPVVAIPAARAPHETILAGRLPDVASATGTRGDVVAMLAQPPAIELRQGAALPAPTLAIPIDPETIATHEQAGAGEISAAGICVAEPKVKQAAFSTGVPASSVPVQSMSGEQFGLKLALAARAQVDGFVIYNDKYQSISYPNGDVSSLFGVCTDVIVRAYRALGVDLQVLVQEARAGTGDRNIDHRRTEVLRRFFAAQGESLPITQFPEDYQPGDIVSYYRPQNQHTRTHIAIVSSVIAPSGRPMIIHNRGWGPQLEDGLFVDEITGHYRYSGARRAPASVKSADVVKAGLGQRAGSRGRALASSAVKPASFAPSAASPIADTSKDVSRSN